MNVGSDINEAILQALANAQRSGETRYLTSYLGSLYVEKSSSRDAVPIYPIDTLASARRRVIQMWFGGAKPNPVPDAVRGLAMVVAVLTMSIGVAIFYDQYKKTKAPQPDQLPIFNQGPETIWTSGPYGVVETPPSQIA